MGESPRRLYSSRGEFCIIDGCDSSQLSRGWCSKHYQRWLDHGDPFHEKFNYEFPERCTKCQINQKPNNHSWCLDCRNENARIRGDGGNLARLRRYKLTSEDIYYMWLYQGGRCDSCKDRIDLDGSKSFHVDHDNSCCSKEKTRNSGTCGKCVRGLLCGSCNQGLGNFKDNVQRLKGAIAYLTQMEA